MSKNYDAAVLGGGPAGYVCAIRLSQLGFNTVWIELRPTLGGTCLNVGCIPSKSLLNLSENYQKAKKFSDMGIEIGKLNLNLEKMMENKDKAVSNLTKGIEFLFKKNKISYLNGVGSLLSNNEIEVETNTGTKNKIIAKNIIISTGSEPSSLPGVKYDEDKIISSTTALSLKEVPKKNAYNRGGYIGLELGSVWSRLGSEIHVIEFLDHITPGMDKEISQEFLKILKKQGINFHLKTKVKKIIKKRKGCQSK